MAGRRMARSNRYRKEREKLSAPRKTNSIVAGTGTEDMKQQWTNFNIKPGMMTWQSMPEGYKVAYQKEQERLDKFKRQADKEYRNSAEGKEIAIQKALKEKALQDRIDEMEKRIKDNRENAEKVGKEHLDKKKKKGKEKKKPTDIHLDNAVCNFIDAKFFETRAQMVDKERTKKIKDNRPKILLISDVCGWAWWNKSKYLQMYLKDEFDVTVQCTLGPESKGINTGAYDLYLTYGYSYVGLLQRVPMEKRISGITAHRPLNVIQSYMALAHYLHANSKLLLRDLAKAAKHNRIWYVPNGVDERLFVPVDPIGDKKRLVAGHVGKKCEAKGQDEIIIPAFQSANVESIYNMNDYRSRRPYCEMVEFYQGMDVFVVASEEDGTPNGALEAAACGRPIISNRIGNMPEFIVDGYNGFLVKKDVNEYIDKLNYLNENREMLKIMGENARKTIEDGWTWKIQSDNYRQMFKDILK
jgi:glycosyltransferase involved in cell wall biosynthesis